MCIRDSSSFGVRNFQSIDQSFQEVLRVLKPGGTFLFIELSTPELSPAKELYALYSKHVMPVMAGLLTKNAKEYALSPIHILGGTKKIHGVLPPLR